MEKHIFISQCSQFSQRLKRRLFPFMEMGASGSTAVHGNGQGPMEQSTDGSIFQRETRKPIKWISVQMNVATLCPFVVSLSIDSFYLPSIKSRAYSGSLHS